MAHDHKAPDAADAGTVPAAPKPAGGGIGIAQQLREGTWTILASDKEVGKILVLPIKDQNNKDTGMRVEHWVWDDGALNGTDLKLTWSSSTSDLPTFFNNNKGRVYNVWGAGLGVKLPT